MGLVFSHTPRVLSRLVLRAQPQTRAHSGKCFSSWRPNQQAPSEGRRQGEGSPMQEGGNGRSARARCRTGRRETVDLNQKP